MEVTVLHILLLVPAFTLTAQELVKLSVSPNIYAECGKQVTLQCNVSSSLDGQSITYMEWSNNRASLCSVDSKGSITHNRSTPSNFTCMYEHGQLSLIFPNMQPLGRVKGESYMCKLRSTHGVKTGYTTVKLQECVRMAEGVSTSNGSTCNFSVYPDGDVHWFHGSRKLSDGSTTKRVGEGGWVIVSSHLETKSSDVPYTCSLKSTRSGRYIANASVPRSVPEHSRMSNGVRSQGPVLTVLCITILLADILI